MTGGLYGIVAWYEVGVVSWDTERRTSYAEKMHGYGFVWCGRGVRREVWLV